MFSQGKNAANPFGLASILTQAGRKTICKKHDLDNSFHPYLVFTDERMYHYANAFVYFLEQTTPIFCLHLGQIKTKSTSPKSVSLCNKTREDCFFISELGANNIRLQLQTGFGQSKEGRLLLELSRPTFTQTTPDFFENNNTKRTKNKCSVCK